MHRFGLYLLVCVVALIQSVQPPQNASTSAPSASQPKQLPTPQQIQDFLAATDDAQCRAENQELTRKLETAQLYFTFGIGTGVGLIGSLCVAGWFYRKWLAPKTPRAKQVWVLIPAAIWSSFCMIGVASAPELMLHPINATVTALLWASPALFFAGIAFWWFSPQRPD